MSELGIASLILAVEFALVAWTILFLVLRRQRQQARSDAAHAEQMMETMDEHEPTRRDALAQLFESTYKLEGEELTEKVDEFVEREKAFYTVMTSIYLQRDSSALEKIPLELAKVLAPWVQMTPRGMVHESAIGDLKNEKEMLSVELEETKQSLEQLMEEYMAAFSRGAAASPPKEVDSEKSYFDIQDDETPAPVPSPEPAQEQAEEIDDLFAAAEPKASDAKSEDDQVDRKPASLESADQPAHDDTEEEQARQELEGLADLFDPPSDKD